MTINANAAAARLLKAGDITLIIEEQLRVLGQDALDSEPYTPAAQTALIKYQSLRDFAATINLLAEEHENGN